MQLQYLLSKLAEKADHVFLNRLLRLTMDKNIADYITAKNNIVASYKDMIHTNACGVIPGLHFSSLVLQFYGLLVDLLILGLQQAAEMAGPPTMPHDFLGFQNFGEQGTHPIVTNIYMPLRFSESNLGGIVLGKGPKV